jgi:hypothetical protein
MFFSERLIFLIYETKCCITVPYLENQMKTNKCSTFSFCYFVSTKHFQFENERERDVFVSWQKVKEEKKTLLERVQKVRKETKN